MSHSTQNLCVHPTCRSLQALPQVRIEQSKFQNFSAITKIDITPTQVKESNDKRICNGINVEAKLWSKTYRFWTSKFLLMPCTCLFLIGKCFDASVQGAQFVVRWMTERTNIVPGTQWISYCVLCISHERQCREHCRPGMPYTTLLGGSSIIGDDLTAALCNS